MLQKLNSRYNDNGLLIFLGLIIALFPLTFLLGSLLVNLNTILISLIFITFVLKKKYLYIFNDKFFILLVLLWLSFLINLFFSTNFENSLTRVLGFVRFILLALTIKIFFENSSFKLKKLVFSIWLIIFIIISFDLVFEFIVGNNILGFKSPMAGRLSGFLNQELKIGHLYSAIFLICAVYILIFTKKNRYFFIFLFLSICISLLIGERSNFIRVMLMSILFISFYEKENFLKKIFSIFFTGIIIVLFISFNSEYNKRFWGQFAKPIVQGNIKTDKVEIKERFSFKEVINFTVYGANYDRAYRVFLDNKIFGVGIKNYRNESNKKKYENKNLHFNANASSIHPHQVHLELLAETGIFGYLVFIIFIICSFYLSYKNFLKSKNLINLSSFLYIFFSLTPFLPSGSFFTTYGATLFWINYSLMISKIEN